MRNHIKVFTTFWNTGDILSQSYQCFVCYEWNAVDIHHISGRGMGGSKTMQKIMLKIYLLFVVPVIIKHQTKNLIL